MGNYSGAPLEEEAAITVSYLKKSCKQQAADLQLLSWLTNAFTVPCCTKTVAVSSLNQALKMRPYSLKE